MTHEKVVKGVHYLNHCGSWFGFPVPVEFVEHGDGGYFASKDTGAVTRSVEQRGFSEPHAHQPPH
jgi:hypothetical protein